MIKEEAISQIRGIREEITRKKKEVDTKGVRYLQQLVNTNGSGAKLPKREKPDQLSDLLDSEIRSIAT